MHKVIDTVSVPLKKMAAPIRNAIFGPPLDDSKLTAIAKLGEEKDNDEDRAEAMGAAMANTIRNVAAHGDKEVIERRMRAMTSELEIAGGRRKSLVDVVPMSGKSCFVFSHRSTIRIVCHEIAHHKYFNNFIIICILISSICLGMEDPTMEGTAKEHTLKQMDRVFTYIFTFEMTIKIVALGFVLHIIPGR